LVDKPTGWTSHDVVAKIRSTIKTETGQNVKVGHTGTLDPVARGLMLILVGSYTKKAGDFSKLDKTYEGELKLGEVSTTGDSEGEKTKVNDKRPSFKDVEEALKSFVGEVEQTPPVYSALKVNGQRAYKLAREGRVVQLKSRKVKIYQIGDISYNYPSLKFAVRVSSGTYIRSLATDIGDKLRTGAYLLSLHRTSIGSYDIKNAQSIDKLIINDIITL